MPSPDDVLEFWFGPDTSTASADRVARWFTRDESFDADIRRRFGTAVAAAPTGALDVWASTPRGWLALLLVLDQFPRNIHRGTPLAFAGDAQARAIALAGIARGDDQLLQPIERVFCYLPLEHAEDRALQERCIALFTALRDMALPAQREVFGNFLDYAKRHQAVIAQFGRFPHRNGVLGRASTPVEETYLAQPGAGF